MHNESMADRVVDGTAESVNGNGNPNNIEGFNAEIHMSPLVTKVAVGCVGVLLGAFLGKKINARGIAAKTAPVVREAADKVEEVAA